MGRPFFVGLLTNWMTAPDGSLTEMGFFEGMDAALNRSADPFGASPVVIRLENPSATAVGGIVRLARRWTAGRSAGKAPDELGLDIVRDNMQYTITGIRAQYRTEDEEDVPLENAYVTVVAELDLPSARVHLPSRVPYCYYALFRLERAILGNPYGTQLITIGAANTPDLNVLKSHGCAVRAGWHPNPAIAGAWYWMSPLAQLDENLKQMQPSAAAVASRGRRGGGGGVQAGEAVRAMREAACEFQCSVWADHPWLVAGANATDNGIVALRGHLERHIDRRDRGGGAGWLGPRAADILCVDLHLADDAGGSAVVRDEMRNILLDYLYDVALVLDARLEVTMAHGTNLQAAIQSYTHWRGTRPTPPLSVPRERAVLVMARRPRPPVEQPPDAAVLPSS
jgi:hypothetical protein